MAKPNGVSLAAPWAAVVFALAPAVMFAVELEQCPRHGNLDITAASPWAGPAPSFADDDEVFIRSPSSPGYFLIVGDGNLLNNVLVEYPHKTDAVIWKLSYRSYDINGVCEPCLVSIQHRASGRYLQPPDDIGGSNVSLAEKERFFTMRGKVKDNNHMIVSISVNGPQSTKLCLASPPPGPGQSVVPIKFEACASSPDSQKDATDQRFAIKSTTFRSGDEVLVRRTDPYTGKNQYMAAMPMPGGEPGITVGSPTRKGKGESDHVAADAREVPTMVWKVVLADAGKGREKITSSDLVFIKPQKIPGSGSHCASGSKFSHYVTLPGDARSVGVNLAFNDTEPPKHHQVAIVPEDAASAVVAFNTRVRFQRVQGESLLPKCVVGKSGLNDIPFERGGCPTKNVAEDAWLNYVVCQGSNENQIFTLEVA